LFKLGKLKDRMYTATGRAIAQERHTILEEFFQRLLAEWNGEK
jgi:HD superfamily phosphodiesterase